MSILCETLVGLVSGSRDLLVYTDSGYAESDRLCIDLALRYLSRGHVFAGGWIPYVEWLSKTEISDTLLATLNGDRLSS